MIAALHDAKERLIVACLARSCWAGRFRHEMQLAVLIKSCEVLSAMWERQVKMVLNLVLETVMAHRKPPGRAGAILS